MNTSEKDAWYHCGHCGALFQSDFGFDEDRQCEVCQRKPGVGLWPVVNSITPVASAKVASFHKTGEKARNLTRTSSEKTHRVRTVFRFALIWILLLLGVVGLTYFLKSAPDKSRDVGVMDLNKVLSKKDQMQILNQVLPECDRVIHGFLSATTFEDRSIHVARPAELRFLMEAFYKDHEFPQINVNTLKRTGQQWIKLSNEWIVLTHWKDTGGENEFDAVLRKGSDGWKLDWPHFVRYSEAPWSLFLAGEGKLDQAEFRLLVRQNKNDDAPKVGRQRMMIVLATSAWGKPKQITTESPVIVIDSTTDEGQLLESAFELLEKNQAVGHGELKPLDPDGFVRVRVKVTRDELGGEYRLTINELKACHWMDSDLSGF